MQTEIIKGGSLLSTKQRLAQTALAIEKPKPKLHVPASKSVLSALSFKKNPAPSDSTIRVQETDENAVGNFPDRFPTPDASNAPFDTPFLSSHALNAPESAEEYVSLVDYEPDPFASFGPAFEPEYDVLIASEVVLTTPLSLSPVLRTSALASDQAQPDKPSELEVEAFLKDVMPPM